MDKEQMRAAVAEIVFESKGYTYEQRPKGTEGYRHCDLSGMWILKDAEGYVGCNWDTKKSCREENIKEIAQRNNYPEDLNAMHEAEKVLFGNHKLRYCESVAMLTGHDSMFATAAQRCEAFLRVMRPELFSK